MKHLRFFLSLISFCVIFGLIAFPQLLFLDLIYRLLGREPSYRRQRIAYWTVIWGDLVFRIACRLMRIKTHFNLPDPVTTPVIMIANHQSTFDAPLITTIFKRMGIMNPRWVVKKEIFDVPAIGWMSRESGCIPVSRSKDPKDIERLTSGALRVFNDQACIFLFPEGTRFKRTDPTSEFKHLLPPKRRGFEFLTKFLPTYHVLSIRFHWSPSLQADTGTTLFQILDLYGRHLFIDGRLVPADIVAADDDWLLHEWERNEAILDSLSH